jgi:hypothetical protein
MFDLAGCDACCPPDITGALATCFASIQDLAITAGLTRTHRESRLCSERVALHKNPRQISAE